MPCEMTYNFDPERWYEDQQRFLQMKRDAGVLDQAAFERAVADVERRYEEMLSRLDHTYQLKPSDKRG